MSEGNSLDKKRSQDRMCKRNFPHKKEASMGCVKTLPRNIERVIFEQMCQFRYSLHFYVCVSRFVFVLFCFVGLFSKAVFDANFGFSCFVFLSL